MILDVYVYSPYTDYHQSNITIMFNTSGVGVQVGCKYGMLHVRVSAPYSLFVSSNFDYQIMSKHLNIDYLYNSRKTQQACSDIGII